MVRLLFRDEGSVYILVITFIFLLENFTSLFSLLLVAGGVTKAAEVVEGWQ